MGIYFLPKNEAQQEPISFIQGHWNELQFPLTEAVDQKEDWQNGICKHYEF